MAKRISYEEFARILEEHGIKPTYARWYLWQRASKEIVDLYNDVIGEIAKFIRKGSVSRREYEELIAREEELHRRFEEIRGKIYAPAPKEWSLVRYVVLNPIDVDRADKRTWRILDDRFIPDYTTTFDEMIWYIEERLREKDNLLKLRAFRKFVYVYTFVATRPVRRKVYVEKATGREFSPKRGRMRKEFKELLERGAIEVRVEEVERRVEVHFESIAPIFFTEEQLIDFCDRIVRILVERDDYKFIYEQPNLAEEPHSFEWGDWVVVRAKTVEARYHIYDHTYAVVRRERTGRIPINWYELPPRAIALMLR
ncbi:MAG TPA: hypothetical protein ENG61_01135 [Candidatus Korarchaeota archaeon]|nr:hypothetical protein [Candidatus Korarchaeota archaeon]